MQIVEIYRKLFWRTCLVLLFFVSLNSITAQTIDSVWYLEWEQVVEGRRGEIYQAPPLKMWLTEGRARVEVSDEEYLTIVGDSVNIIDTYYKEYAVGPTDQLDMTWLVILGFQWKRYQLPGVVFAQSNRQKTIAGIPGRGMSVELRAGKLMQPVRLDMLVGFMDDVPVPDAELDQLHTAFMAANTDKSIDFAEISDTLRARRLIPLSTAMVSQVRNDTNGIFKTKLHQIERIGVSSNFFDPPQDYEGRVMRVPTAAERWELTAIPLPGGSRKGK